MSEPNPINPLFAEKGTGALSDLEASKFKYSQLRYPLDVDSNKRFSYWMQFNVLMNIGSKYVEQLSFGDTKVSSEMQLAQDKFWEGRKKPIEDLLHKLRLSFFDPHQYDQGSNLDLNSDQITKMFRPQTIKTKQSIFLYMPDTLNWSFQNNWDEINVQEVLGKAGMALEAVMAGAKFTSQLRQGGGVFDSLKNAFNNGGKAPIAEALGSFFGGGAEGRSMGLSAVGYAFNPGVEVLYKSPTLRQFQFEFVFAPRNKKEAEAVIEIIQMFKFHSALETPSGGTAIGRYYIPPSQFDIEFHGRNGEIWQLGKIKSHCVLNNVTVNYGQSGRFAAFEDGTPTNIQLQLNFQETTYVTKEDVERGV